MYSRHGLHTFDPQRRFTVTTMENLHVKYFSELNEKFGISSRTTPAEATIWKLNYIKKASKVLYESMMTNSVLAWIVSARGCLQNVYGFSPNQLAISQNIELPTVIDDELPAMESHTSSDLIRENLNALHSACENFVKAESSEKIRHTLLKNVRIYSELDFQ